MRNPKFLPSTDRKDLSENFHVQLPEGKIAYLNEFLSFNEKTTVETVVFLLN